MVRCSSELYKYLIYTVEMFYKFAHFMFNVYLDINLLNVIDVLGVKFYSILNYDDEL